jgi:hypothetical protein
MIGY